MIEFPDRPAPPRSLLDSARAWVRWVGAARLAVCALAVGAVLAGGYWLVKPPATTTESKLPYAGTASTASTTTAATSHSVESAFVIVHVAGAVIAPGVYQLPTGSRVIDAVHIAGGFAADANADGVNLAALVADSERIYVPAVGEVLAPIVTVDDGSADSAEVWPINVNVADAQRLEDLPGVGPATAAAIIAHREQHGPFASVDQLAQVRGIGPAKLDAIRGLVTV